MFSVVYRQYSRMATWLFWWSTCGSSSSLQSSEGFKHQELWIFSHSSLRIVSGPLRLDGGHWWTSLLRGQMGGQVTVMAASHQRSQPSPRNSCVISAGFRLIGSLEGGHSAHSVWFPLSLMLGIQFKARKTRMNSTWAFRRLPLEGRFALPGGTQ